MNPSSGEEPQRLRELESEGEEDTIQESSDNASENLSGGTLNTSSTGTALRKRTNITSKTSDSETMIPLKSEDIERAVVRKDGEVHHVSGKTVSSIEDATEITKISTVDEDHPEVKGHQSSKGDVDDIVVKTPGKTGKDKPWRIKTSRVGEEDEDEPTCRGPCGNKWREHHFEFELDVSALQERAAERAERLAEQAKEVAEQAGRYAGKVKQAAWRVLPHNVLPNWLKDNEYLQDYHRPPMPSFKSCFRSIFRIHTETGNIWTHLIGFILFIILMIYFLVNSILDQNPWQEIAVYMAFFTGAISCLFCSFFFHTCSCHSVEVSNVLSKLDYSGITFLIVGSFVPWLYFGFYCELIARTVYSAFIIILGIVCLIVAMKDTFATPEYRPCRAALFISLGLSAVIPAIHYIIANSLLQAVEGGAFGWMLLMASLYIGGALLYAFRIPERFFPGKCDVWFQSHQIFHVFVVAAAMVHFHGLNTMAAYREEVGECSIEGEFTTPVTTPLFTE